MKITISILILIFSLNAMGAEVTYRKLKYKNKVPGANKKVTIKLDTKVFNKTLTKDFYGTQIRAFAPFPTPKLVTGLKMGLIRMGGNEFDIMNWKTAMVYVPGYGFSRAKPIREMIDTIRAYGSEPIYQVNMMGYMPEFEEGEYILRPTATAKSAGEMVRHMNGEKNVGIKHVCLGNEPSQWPETHRDIWPGGTSSLSADEYIDRLIRFSLEIRAAQEDASGNPNDIKIWGPEISSSWLDWQTINFIKDCKWASTPGQADCSYGGGKFKNYFPYFFYRLAKAEADPKINPKKYKLLDYATFHYYPVFRTDIADLTSIIKDKNGKQRVWEMMDATRIFYDKNYTNTIDLSSYKNINSEFLNRITGWKNKYYPQAKLALTEYALDSDGRATGYHPMIRKLFMADLIGILAESEVVHFTRAFLNATLVPKIPWVLVEDEKKTDLYTLYNLFTKNFLGKLLPVDDEFNGVAKAYATYKSIDEKKGYINLFLVNKVPSEKKVKISFELKNGSPKEILDYKLPPWSVAHLRIPNHLNENSEIRVSEFGARELNVEVDPYYDEKQSK